MIANLKPYTEYKKAGLPWLDVVPVHWNMVPNRALMQEQRQVVGVNATDYTLLSLTLGGIIPRNMDNPKGKFPAKFNTYKVVRPEDLVFCLFDIDETPRAVGYSKLNGMITGAYDVFSPRQNINPRFLYYYYLSLDEGKMLKPIYTGLRKTIQRGVFASLKAPHPPPDEQATIVRFLDWTNGRLERTIRAKRKVIALLNEQKQVIIHRAVTRGIDLSLPLKPSGIPWLGDIPAHWEVRKLRQLLERATERNRADLPLLSVVREKGVIKRDIANLDENHNFIPDDLSNYKVVKVGQLAMNKMKAWQGSYGVSNDDGIVSPAYFVFNVRGVNGEFFHAALRSKAYVPFFTQASDGVRVGQWDLAESRMKEISFFFPSVSEQIAIVRFIKNATAEISAAISRLEREIELLREYRTCLVADVVTGELDVREAAAHLPEEATPDVAEASDETESTDEVIAV